MVVDIPDNGLLLEGSGKAMAGLPTQAFAITLSDSVIEDMIKCVQDGGEVHLSLGNTPVSNFSPFSSACSRRPDGQECVFLSRLLLCKLTQQLQTWDRMSTIAAQQRQ